MSGDGRLVIVGAGPAGLAAAQAAAKAGAAVLLLDEQPAPGGQVWRNAHRRRADPAAFAMAGDSDAGAVAALDGLDHPQIEHVRGATVVDATPGRRVSWLGPLGTAPRMQETDAAGLIVATGAMERPVPFPGWTLPGVMGIGALQLLLKQGVVPHGRIVLAGQGALLQLTLAQLRRAGVDVVGLLDIGGPLPPLGALAHIGGVVGDPGLFAKSVGLAIGRLMARIPTYRRVRNLRALGETAVTGVRFSRGGRDQTLACDLLAVHDGVIPNTQVTRILGLKHAWHAATASFAPVVDEDGKAADGIWVAGDGAGIGGADVAQVTGSLAGLAAAAALGATVPSVETAALRRRLARLMPARALIDALYEPFPVSVLLDDETPVCRCEAVTAGMIKEAVAAGAVGPNRVKVHTRCGMGPCQGRMCGNPLTRLLAEVTGAAPDAVGAMRIRPPLKPVLVGDYLEADGGP